MSQFDLTQVFGIYKDPPEKTYVDRSGLDGRFDGLLATGRHLVIHGPSKQGKTALRARALPDEKCVIVQSRQRPATVEQVYSEILQQIGVQRTVSREVSKSGELSMEGGGSAGLSIPLIGKATADMKGSGKASLGTTTTTEPMGNTTSSLPYVADEIKKSGRRVVIEDFHYIDESAKKALAFDLKAFFEYGVPIILVGAWEEQHVLIAYNGDLSGRVEEINVAWTDEELFQVLRLGQAALNIQFSGEIIKQMILDASGNVGLLQRLAERICREAGVNKTEIGDSLGIRDIQLLDAARSYICSEEAVRYRNFGWSVTEGFKTSREKAKATYMRIIQVCVEASEADLLAGLHQDQIIERVGALDANITGKNVKQALQWIDRLQSEKNIYPVIATFNLTTRRLSRADRELLFYRKYGGPNWPWEDSDE
jgi:Mrp family chromosome partitioning ATPase